MAPPEKPAEQVDQLVAEGVAEGWTRALPLLAALASMTRRHLERTRIGGCRYASVG
jgi:hypothetical protein